MVSTWYRGHQLREEPTVDAGFTRAQILAFRAAPPRDVVPSTLVPTLVPLAGPPLQRSGWTCAHPSYNRYASTGCRCDGCRESNRRYKRNLRHR